VIDKLDKFLDWLLRPRRWLKAFIWLSVPLAISSLVLGLLLKNGTLVTTSLGLFAVTVVPGILILAGFMLAFVLVLLAVAFTLGQDAARRRALSKLFKALEAKAGQEDTAVSEIVARLVALCPSEDPRVTAQLKRLDYPLYARISLLPLAGNLTLEEISRRKEDPLAPFAWLRRLEIDQRGTIYWRKTQLPVATKLDEEAIRDAWAETIGTSKPFSLPVSMGRDVG
jgi:hypothetical protein